MYQVSQNFIDYCKRHQRTYKSATITYDDNGTTKTITSDKIIKIQISATPYVDYQLIGQAPAKKIHINLYGTNYDLTNKEISVTTTMIYDDNTTETLNLGTYLMTSDYESQVKDQCSYTGYDYMIKFDTTYNDEGLNYPCTLQDVLNNICTQNNIELHSINITNGNLVVNGNNFDGAFTYRDVIKQIAQVSGTFAYIDRFNKLHIDNLDKVGATGGTILQFPLQGTLQTDSDTSQDNYKDEITPSYYMADFKSSRLYGPVNKIQITQTDVEDATYKEDAQSISRNGIQTITINDNFFLGTIDAREYAIENLWTALYGLTYIPFNSTYLGFPYLEMGDLIEVEQLDGTTIESYVFNYTFTYNGGYMGTLETPTITRTQEAYPSNSIEQRMGKYGFEVDRANKEVRAVAEDLSGVQAELTLKIDKDDNDQIVSMINASADIIRLNSNRLIINSTYFKLDENGYITATGGDIGGFSLGTNLLTANLVSPYVYTQADVDRIGQIITGDVIPTTQDFEKLDVDRNGVINILDRLQVRNYVLGNTDFSGQYVLDTQNSLQALQVINNNNEIVGNIGVVGSYFKRLGSDNLYTKSQILVNTDSTGSYGITIGHSTFNDGGVDYDTNEIRIGNSSGTDGQIALTAHNPTISLMTNDLQELILLNGETGNIRCVSLTQTSLEENKKDFEKYKGALKEIENIDIYKYRMKNEDGKKHIGFVIGDDFKYSQEVTSKDNDGVDIYSFVSMCCQAIKELNEEIKRLKGENNE